jgi:hypothetical protein
VIISCYCPSWPKSRSMWADSLGNQVHSMIRTLCINNDAVFQDDSAPICTAETVQSLKNMKVKMVKMAF